MTMASPNDDRSESGHPEPEGGVDAPMAGDLSNKLFEEGPPRLPEAGDETSAASSRDDDEASLFERARTQWQLGEWVGLIELVQSSIQNHPERAKLAALAAVAHSQLGHESKGRQYASLAMRWGCSKDLLGRLLLSGAYNSLGVARLKAGERDAAIRHFQNSIACVTPKADTYALARARAVRETAALGDLPEAAEFLDQESQRIQRSGVLDSARLRIFEVELEQLRHELSLVQRRGQLPRGTGNPSQTSMPSDREPSLDELEQYSQSQLGQDIWVLERTDFKRNGFFVEIGATDGVALSNTWLLERHFDWSGICAEPNPSFYRQLVKNRTCTVADACIAGTSGREEEFILAAEFGGLAEYAEKDFHADKRAAYQAHGHSIMLTTISLDDFLEMHNAPRDIDYLSIDTEGSELDILAPFPFRKWRIKYLTVEHNYSALRPKLRTLLEGHGYRCFEKEWDDWYEYLGP